MTVGAVRGVAVRRGAGAGRGGTQHLGGGHGSRLAGLSLKGGGGEGVHNANRNECSRGRSLLHEHGTFCTSEFGGWQQLAVGGWRLAVGGWRSLGAVLKGCPLQKKTECLRTALSLCLGGWALVLCASFLCPHDP